MHFAEVRRRKSPRSGIRAENFFLFAARFVLENLGILKSLGNLTIIFLAKLPKFIILSFPLNIVNGSGNFITDPNILHPANRADCIAKPSTFRTLLPF